MTLESHWRRGPATARHAPLRIRAGALGDGVPMRDLVLSPQHRVLVRLGRGEILVPAKALLDRRGVGRLAGCSESRYLHLVLDRHVLLLAEGLVCESFWPGPTAMAGLTAAQRARVQGIMGPSPQPARAFLAVQPARRLLA